jgi:hypothetical protein
MRSIELPVTGAPVMRAVTLDERNTEFVKIVAWSNGAALYMAKNPAPVSPTRPLNPHAPWMQGVGYLVVRDVATNRMMPADRVDNALECLDAYNAWKKECQHQCLFPGSAGDLVRAAESRLQSTAARTKFASFVQDGDETRAGQSEGAKTWFR